MEKNEELRVIVLTLLLGILYAIFNYTKDKTYDSFSVEMFFRFFSILFFKIIFPVFILYLLTLSFSLSYTLQNKKNFVAWKNFFFDFGISLVSFVLYFELMLFILLYITPKAPILIGAYSNIYLIFSSLIGSYFFFRRPLDNFLKLIKKIFILS